ncbi:MAG: OsmC family protein [Anaerolineales bacterium]|nr:OsmC family protein [Anaerolineales bacterium]TET97617.1 MAG: OsmC family peroxiredoxin [Anaerolineales bacterium]
MDAKVTWSKRLSFIGEADTGFSVPLGANPQVGGDNDGFRPMELIAIGIAGCTGMDVISILQKKRQNVTAFEVQLRSQQAQDHPHVFTQIEIEYLISGHDVNETAVQRAIELSENKYCPAQAMFNKILPIRLSYKILQAEQ